MRMMTSDVFHLYHLDESICSYRGFWKRFLLLLYFAYKFLQVNSVKPDQMLHFVASQLALHCLQGLVKRG